jgi:hypothetical protein
LLGKPCVLACSISRSTQRSTLLFAVDDARTPDGVSARRPPELQALTVAAKISSARQTRTFELYDHPNAPRGGN